MSYNKLKSRLEGEDVAIVIFAVIVLLMLIFGIYWLLSWLLMWGWNLVMPAIFNLPVINQWMAFAIIIITNIIGSGFKSSNTQVKN